MEEVLEEIYTGFHVYQKIIFGIVCNIYCTLLPDLTCCASGTAK